MLSLLLSMVGTWRGYDIIVQKLGHPVGAYYLLSRLSNLYLNRIVNNLSNKIEVKSEQGFS